MDKVKSDFLAQTALAAQEAEHIWPQYAACEVGLESRYGTSALFIADNNGFGVKQHIHPIYGTHNLPTHEFLNSEWVQVMASWVHYPALRDCFIDRMETLRRLAAHYPHYAAALAAPDGETFINEVSATWSTDRRRAIKVLNIYNFWKISV